MKYITLATFIFFLLPLTAGDFYLPLVGYSTLNKRTKNNEEKKTAGICCLIGADMFILIDGKRIDCQSTEQIGYNEWSKSNSALASKATVTINCDNSQPMQIILNFVDKQLTNIYLFGDSIDYEFYLGID